MTETDLALIRDEVGDQPSDVVLEDHHEALGHWILVALRVLKRRRAGLAAGGGSVTSLAIPGALSVGMAAGDLRGLDTQIAQLEAMYAAETGVSVGGGTGGRRLTRATAR